MRLVVKTGSSVLSNAEGGLDRSAIGRLAKQLGQAHHQGHEVILVSSGAIAAGAGRFGWKERPTDLALKQAAAAVGQLALMEAYEGAFKKDGLIPAQILLTRDDLTHRQRYLNIRTTLLELLSLKTIPIINENDSVSTEEIQFGDNDTLSAVVATKVEADKLILLSDVKGLFEQDSDGRLSDRLISEVDRVTPELERRLSKHQGSKMSVGGMAAKVMAAKMATAAGIETWIASGREDSVIQQILSGAPQCGTRFLAKAKRLEARKSWIAFGRATKGFVTIDEGALKALQDGRKSLLPSGIKSVHGSFSIGETIGIKLSKGAEIARGLTNFSSHDVKIIKGHHTAEIASLLGRAAAAEVVHRDNLVFLE